MGHYEVQQEGWYGSIQGHFRTLVPDPTFRGNVGLGTNVLESVRHSTTSYCSARKEQSWFSRRVYEWDPHFRFPGRLIGTSIISLIGLYTVSTHTHTHTLPPSQTRNVTLSSVHTHTHTHAHTHTLPHTAIRSQHGCPGQQVTRAADRGREYGCD